MCTCPGALRNVPIATLTPIHLKQNQISIGYVAQLLADLAQQCTPHASVLPGQRAGQGAGQGADKDVEQGAAQNAGQEQSKFASVFFGGGTPSLFAPHHFQDLLEHMALRPNAEVTMEANPGTTEYMPFRDYLNGGVNRLSIGAQSFNNTHLKLYWDEYIVATKQLEPMNPPGMPVLTTLISTLCGAYPSKRYNKL